MEQSDLAQYLDLLLSNEDIEHAKPHPEIYATAMAQLGVEGSETLVVEDNDHGVASARAAGAHVLVVDSPQDVTYDRIVEQIRAVEQAA